ncbi:MAG: NAD(P)H-binding protein [Gemmatimonadota bacterium]
MVGVAGASGFVGRNLLNSRPSGARIRALSRSERESEAGIEWVGTDLFSYQSTLKALEGVDVAVYLVHSMLPSTRLFQGSFQDTDLLLADNFSRACVATGVKRIIYLGGLIPDGKISTHLESRKEVEEVFAASGIPTTVLRAGMIVGHGGSSFEILKNLVLNLPAMILPHWTKSSTQTLYIDDLVRVLTACIESDRFAGRTIDVVNGEDITYADLIEQTAKHFDRQIASMSVPVNYLGLSKLWVTLFGQSDYELVSPLVDSLRCDLPSPGIPEELSAHIQFRSFEDMLGEIPKAKFKKGRKGRSSKDTTVRSIHRRAEKPLSEEEICEEYFHWLPEKLNGLLSAEREGDLIKFVVTGVGDPLLVLKLIKGEHNLDRVKFHIVGGLLTRTTDTGWLEFRSVAGGKYVLSSINEFMPSLPWYIYKLSQAPVHAWVMNEFSRHLASLNGEGGNVERRAAAVR